MALDMADIAGIPVDNLTANDVANMDTQKVLDFVWLLISKTLESEEVLSEKLSKLLPEGAPALGPADLSSKFADGKLFAQMIAKENSTLINADSTGGESLAGDALYQLTQHYKMRRVLDASDLQANDLKSMRVFLPFVLEAISGRTSEVIVEAPVVAKPKAAPVVVVPKSNDNNAEKVVAYTPTHSSATAEEQQVEHTHATSKLRAFSQDIGVEHPGKSFTIVETDGRTEEGAGVCSVCGDARGDGKCFKLGADDYVHSRCFSCGECRKDFKTGVFYENEKNQLVCATHYFLEKGVLCGSCDLPITEYFVACCEKRFHEKCYKCHGSCRQVLTTEKHFNVGGKPYCGECNAETQGIVCKRCRKGVEEPRKELDALWHANCFTCDRCQKGFGAGDTPEENNGFPYHSECLKSMQESLSPTGGAYAKPAQSAKAAAMALKRRSVNNRPRPRTSSRSRNSGAGPTMAEEGSAN
jgi:hypothetical protein